MTDEITGRLLEFIRDEIVIVDQPIEVETDLLLSGAVDSLGVIRITQWIEDQVGISVDPGDVTLENFQTISAMTAYVDRRASV